MLALTIGFIYVLLTSRNNRKQQSVGDIIVHFDQELDFVTKEDVTTIIQPYLSEEASTLDQISLKKMERALEENDYISSSDVYVNNQMELEVDVRQKRPLYRVINNSGVSYYLDQNRYKIPLNNKFTANVPIATGYVPFTADSLGRGDSKAIVELSTLFEFIEQDDFLQSLIAQVDVRRDGDLELVPRTGKHTILLGDASDLEDKFNRLKVFYKEGISLSGWEEYDLVNIKFKGQVIANKRENG